MTRAAVVGASGYTGLELLRLLSGHPDVEVTAVTSRSLAGQKIADVFPALAGPLNRVSGLHFEDPDPEELIKRADFFFTAVPHKAAMSIAPRLLAGGGRLVDLSADFRFNDPDVYAAWYEPHAEPALLAKTVYGLPELHRDRIAAAFLVGNPGCYPTSVILAMAPLLSAGIVDADQLIVDSKSGVSGAGRGASLTTSFCEINDGIMAYKVVGHRHTPEIEQELSRLAGRPVMVGFTPHLVPFSRGILTTAYAPLTADQTGDDLTDLARAFYQKAPFVRVRDQGALPHTLDVRGTNYCDLSYFVDQRTRRVKVVSVIDNLTRGASGQAVCNMNLMLGLPEETGLTACGLRP
jgi:N-acetyl-gamma-glutamyl-phosphate reductase